jgi:formylglycine-generating enzyme required for sulfatase activity
METRGQSATLDEVCDLVALAAGGYRLGEPGEEREVEVGALLIGRHPVTNARLATFAAAAGPPRDAGLVARLAAPQFADHPATGVTFDEALAFCAWASERGGRRVRLPTGAEWEAAARGGDGRPWPWGETFDADRCACAEANAWTTAPVDAHPGGASPCGAEQLAGNVWEWVGDPADEDGWRRVRGGCHLDHAWGVRASRSLPADPGRATHTTGFRIAIEIDPADHDEEVP